MPDKLRTKVIAKSKPMAQAAVKRFRAGWRDAAIVSSCITLTWLCTPIAQQKTTSALTTLQVASDVLASAGPQPAIAEIAPSTDLRTASSVSLSTDGTSPFALKLDQLYLAASPPPAPQAVSIPQTTVQTVLSPVQTLQPAIAHLAQQIAPVSSNPASQALISTGPTQTAAQAQQQVTFDPNHPGMVTAACIEQASAVQQVPIPIIMGLLKTEGGWVGAAVGNYNGSHDLGPMQVNDTTWVPVLARLEFNGNQQLARLSLQWNGCYNIQVGTWIFRQYWNEANGNTARAIGYYNSHNPDAMSAYQSKFIHSLRSLYAGQVASR